MPNDARPGWYWECEADKSHWSSFAAATHVRIVRFFFELAQAGWPQDRLVFPCPKCGRPMRIAYDFPRGEQRGIMAGTTPKSMSPCAVDVGCERGGVGQG